MKIGQPQNAAFPQAVMQANKIAITLWPIMFAAIATQSLKTYATYQAERGIKLMVRFERLPRWMLSKIDFGATATQFFILQCSETATLAKED